MSSRALPRAESRTVERFVYQPAAGQKTDPEPVLPAERRPEPAPDPAAVERSRQEGYADAERRLRAEYEAKLAAERSGIGAALAEFAGQRAGYFERVETEIVNLSLSIARKILHREAQIDPLVLVGLAHVALEKVESATRVRLRVNPSRTAFWEQQFHAGEDGKPAPELVADAAVAPDACVLETDLGMTTLGLETHLKEIEQGFFDLLAQRPR
jgi:flagellar assembly protein FliH